MKFLLSLLLLGHSLTILVAGLPNSRSKDAAVHRRDDDEPYHEKPDFGDCKFPDDQDSLPLFTLGDIVRFPSDTLEDIIAAAAAGEKLVESVTEDGHFWSDGHRLVASFDADTGETAVFPKLSALKPGTPESLDAVLRYVHDSGIFPEDDTTVSHVLGSALSGSQSTNGTNTPVQVYLTDVAINRNVTHNKNTYRVVGPGTKGFFRLDADGKIVSISHRWQKADLQSSGLKRRSQQDVTDDITQQLLSTGFTNAKIENLELVFYDGGKKYIQPAYQYVAVRPSAFDGISSTHTTGFIAAALGLPEKLPTLTPLTIESNITSPVSSNSTHIIPRESTKRQVSTIKTGRYVMRHDNNSVDFEHEAVIFESSLIAHNLGNIFGILFGIFGSVLKFVDSQYFWDRQFLYTTSKETFVDAVDVAFTLGHGNVHQVCTDGALADCDRFFIGSSDQGPVDLGTGSLRYWIIHSCLVIPAPVDYFKSTDSHKAWDPWWGVFNGLHAVVGMREEVYVSDDTSSDLATRLARGESVVNAWLTNKYQHYANAVTEKDFGLDGQPYVKVDRLGMPSAVTVCGHADDTLFDVQRLPKPDCLQMFWYGTPTWMDCGPHGNSTCVSVTPS